MYTNKSIRLLNKALQVLEAIQTANGRVSTHEAELNIWYGIMRDHFKSRIAVNKAIAERLQRYYNRLIIQISQEAIKQDEKQLAHV